MIIRTHQIFLFMNTTRTLLNRMEDSQATKDLIRSAHVSPSRKISQERAAAQRKYKKLTNMSKNQQCDLVRENIASRRKRTPQWKYDSYRISSSFSNTQQQGMNEFPHNNKKYNFQFLDKTLTGGTLHFPSQNTGLFPKPKDELYTKHYKPIAISKRQYNEEFELRTSLFGKTWVDHKRDRIMDKYILQTNPFHTDRSNSLLSIMRPSRKHRFS